MKRIHYLVFLVLSGISVAGQEHDPTAGSGDITVAELRDHMFFLASDELEGRLTGTPGYDKAVQYCGTQLRQAGLLPVCKNAEASPSWYQEMIIDKYSPGPGNSITVAIDTEESVFRFEEDYIIMYGGPFEIKDLTGNLAFVGAGIKEPGLGIDDYKNVDVKNKWAVMYEILPDEVRKKLPNETLNQYLTRQESDRLRVHHAKEAGAIGILLISADSDRNRKILAGAYHDFYTIPGIGQPWFNTDLPSVLIDSSMIEYLFAGQKFHPYKNKKNLKSFVLDKCELTLRKDYLHSTIKSANAVGLLEGSDPILKNEYIVVTAHLDHMGYQDGQVMNGANDDASGSVAVLEIAEALVQSHPGRSVICMLCAGEEEGLLGSYYFTENPPVPLDAIMANINIDMVGCSETDVKGIAPIGAGRIGSHLRDVISEVGNTINDPAINWAFADTCRFVNSSDHYPFHLKNIPSVFFFGGGTADTHSPSDDAETIDYEFLRKSCNLILEVIRELADRPGGLK